MSSRNWIANLIPDFIVGLLRHKDGGEFIYRHQLWRGIMAYGWLSKFFLVISILVGLKFLSFFRSWFSDFHAENIQVVGAQMMNLFEGLYHEGESLFLMGGTKYVILVLTEVMVFHFVRKTAEILTGKAEDSSFQAFVRAQIRMIKVSFASYGLELAATIVLGILIKIVGFDFLKEPLTFFIQCFFLGFVIADNYLERSDVPITEALKICRSVAGVVIAVGLVTYILLLVPIVGAIIAPMVAGVVVTLLFFEYEIKGIIEIPDPKTDPQDQLDEVPAT